MTESNSWVKEGEQASCNGSDVIFTVKGITTTGNGTRMVHLKTVGEPHVETSVWEADLLEKWTHVSGLTFSQEPQENGSVTYVRERLQEAHKLLTDMYGSAVDVRSVVTIAEMISQARRARY